MANESGAPRVKGSVLLARLSYVREHGGEAALEKVIARLPRADQDVLRGWILLIEWYPLDLELRLDDAISEVLSPNDKSKVFLDMGRASAQMNLDGPQKSYVRAGDPHFLLSLAPKIYADYHTAGRRVYERAGDKAALVKTFDAETVTANDCLTVVGWLERAVELSGGKNVKVTQARCRAQGDPHCEYRCAWT